MSDLITALTSFFTFIFNQMTSFANFFITTTLGQLIIGIILVSLVVNLVLKLINR